MKLVLGSESKVPVVGPAPTITLYVLTVRFRRRVSAFFASRLFTMLNTCCMTASWRRSSLPYHAPPHPPPTNPRHHNVTVNNVTVCQSCPSAPMYTHTQPFNGPLSGTTRVSRYQKGKTNLDFIYWSKETVSGSGISWAMYATLHLAPDR